RAAASIKSARRPSQRVCSEGGSTPGIPGVPGGMDRGEGGPLGGRKICVGSSSTYESGGSSSFRRSILGPAPAPALTTGWDGSLPLGGGDDFLTMVSASSAGKPPPPPPPPPPPSTRARRRSSGVGGGGTGGGVCEGCEDATLIR